ncbi:MAG: hypothetical protein M3341_01320 [Actinomycetota bacterium]|nr:hypothetical protein [Actinomycetota bacterium]
MLFDGRADVMSSGSFAAGGNKTLAPPSELLVDCLAALHDGRREEHPHCALDRFHHVLYTSFRNSLGYALWRERLVEEAEDDLVGEPLAVAWDWVSAPSSSVKARSASGDLREAPLEQDSRRQ